QALDTVLLCVGIGWAVIAIGAEVVRWDLMSFSLVLHWLLLAAAFAVWFAQRRLASDGLCIALVVGIVATALFASKSAPAAAMWMNVLLSPLALLALALRGADGGTDDDEDNGARIAAAVVAPFVVAVWVERPEMVAGAGHS